ncbi:MAG: hypothetical protein ACXADA_22545 [Candidatus Hodarchaeales archaeon]
MSETEKIFIQPKTLPNFRSRDQAIMELLITTDQAEDHATFYNDLTSLILIKLTDLGPVIHDHDIHFIQSDENDLTGLATYYSIALGQGQHYNQGLFGPLPFLATDYHSLVYAILVNDTEQSDERFKGQNYILLCFLYHKKLERIVNKCREEIEEIFELYFSSNNDLSQVEHDLENIKAMIQNHMYRNYGKMLFP